jgi:hypothetical protein
VTPEFSQRSNHFDTFDPGVLQSPIIVCLIMMQLVPLLDGA